MNTTKWGPHGWKFLHSIAFNYPEHPTLDQREQYRIFFHACGWVLPCRYCRESYQGFIRELPIEEFLDSQNSLAYWLYLIHNKVNHKLRTQGHPVTNDPSFGEVCDFYRRWRSPCNPTTQSCRPPEPLRKKYK
jgi:hypothetical protein